MRRSDAERLVDIACELYVLATYCPEPERLTIRHCVDELCTTARACAQRLGVTLYADDDEDGAVEAR